MKKDVLIYVAGKISDPNCCEYIKNLNTMNEYADLIQSFEDNVNFKYGTHVPGNDFLRGYRNGNFDYKHYFENNIIILKKCDAVALVPNWKTSDGTKKEIKIASCNDIPILYDLNEVKTFLGVES